MHYYIFYVLYIFLWIVMQVLFFIVVNKEFVIKHHLSAIEIDQDIIALLVVYILFYNFRVVKLWTSCECIWLLYWPSATRKYLLQGVRKT